MDMKKIEAVIQTYRVREFKEALERSGKMWRPYSTLQRPGSLVTAVWIRTEEHGEKTV